MQLFASHGTFIRASGYTLVSMVIKGQPEAEVEVDLMRNFENIGIKTQNREVVRSGKSHQVFV